MPTENLSRGGHSAVISVENLFENGHIGIVLAERQTVVVEDVPQEGNRNIPDSIALHILKAIHEVNQAYIELAKTERGHPGLPLFKSAIDHLQLGQAELPQIMAPLLPRKALRTPCKGSRGLHTRREVLRAIHDGYLENNGLSPVSMKEIQRRTGKSSGAIRAVLAEPIESGIVQQFPDNLVGGFLPGNGLDKYLEIEP